MATPIRLEAVLAKEEAVYGTDAAPVGTADAVRLSQRAFSTFTPKHVWENTREDVSNASLIQLDPALPKGRFGELEIHWDARGAGAAYADPATLPEADALFQACGYDQTVVPSTSVAYDPLDSGHLSATIWGYGSGNIYKFVGCRGSFEIPMTAGAFTRTIFRMQGIMIADPIAGALPALTYASPIPASCVNVALTIGAWSPGAYTASFNAGVEVVRLDSLNATEGIESFEIVAHKPIFTVAARTVALATFDPYDDVRTRTARAIDFTASGPGTFNDIGLAVTEAYARDPGHGENEQMAAWDPVEYICQDAIVLFD